MKLKFKLVNGYGVLVDENPALNKGNLYIDRDGKIKTVVKTEGGLIYSIEDMDEDGFNHHYFDRNCEIMGKIIFAEKELGIDVPVFEWRDFEVEKFAEKEFPHNTGMSIVARGAFKKGYKSNQPKYTEEDLRKITQAAFVVMSNPETVIADFDRWFEKRLQSLQKYPKWVVMESEHDCCKRYVNCKGCDATPEMINYRPKLFTNSEGKQQGVIKELIWA
jgi:hypothetical protein